MNYLLLTICLSVLLMAFIKAARAFGLYDRPNQRSSHNHNIVRGGGIVFLFSGLAVALTGFREMIWFISGLSIVALVSFVDDIKAVGYWPRLLSHLAGILMIIVPAGLTNHIPLPAMLIGIVLFSGILNAYNFMDGINGITGLYSISVLGALQFINLGIEPFINPDMLWYPMIASAVFLIFNFRKKAICFAGDVGSISIAFWITYLLITLIIKTESLAWLLLLSIYGVDSVLTIVHRLWLKQNIFVAHRLHLYQVLANEYRLDHRIVSSGYALLQAGVSALVILLWDKWPLPILGAVIITPLTVFYMVKFLILKEQIILPVKVGAKAVEGIKIAGKPRNSFSLRKNKQSA
jgi:UDP-N-acetylmuramyl pentapeptide phosphotransferase/UDP-N-acetylglucosamine-1-phosphate transferase